MRVKISYTVEIEQVEEEVSEIMSRASTDLDEAYHSIVSTQNSLATKTGDIDEHIEAIDLARKRMMRADQTLEDCASILQGYKIAKNTIEEQKNAIKGG